MAVKVTQTEKERIVKYDINKPPDVFFDTNVWIGMSKNDMAFLEDFQISKSFRYRYTVTNFVELVSHLADEPSVKCPNPFDKFKACFRKIVRLCHAEILPSPEMEFLSEASLQHYLDPAWIPDERQMIDKMEAIANANSIEDIAQFINISHYKKMKQTDSESIKTAFNNFPAVSRPIGQDEGEKALQWFMYIASFFFIERASNGKVTYADLTEKEKAGFQIALTSGSGRLFFNHCMTRIRQTCRGPAKIPT